MRDVETLKPFTKFLMTIGTLPSSYLVSMTYEEQLLWFCNYLQNTVIPTVNNNAEAVEELQNLYLQLKDYVDHYFDNLDVQEEINNKLDEMVEQGTLQEIISEYLNSTAVFGFDTVSDMISATNLINGSYAKTLGYNNINDGGAATYKIRTITNEDVVDGMFIIAMEDNTLVAELVIENGIIYANQLGCDNTGTIDSSVIINTALEKINYYWLNNIKINTLVFEGIYKLDYQVEIPPCAKLRSNGLVKFISNVNNDSTFFIHYLDNNLPATDIEKTRYMSGDLINFESGSILVHSGDKTTDNSIAIEIGDRTNLGEDRSIARYLIRNITITNFTIGILHNSYNVYIANYDHILMELNTTNVKFGLTTQVSNAANNGERITFDKCLFGPATVGVMYGSVNWQTFFNNCSFDYCTDVFKSELNNNYANMITVNNSHIEAFTTLLNGFNINNNNLNISNSDIYNSTTTTTWFVNCECYINITNTPIQIYGEGTCDGDKYILFGQNVNLENTKLSRTTSRNQFFWNNNLVDNFDSIADGDVTLTVDSYIGSWKITQTQVLTGTIVTDNEFYTGHKSLLLTKTQGSGNTPAMRLESPLINIKGNNIIGTLLTYNMKARNQQVIIHYYDSSKNEITTSTSNEWIPDNPIPSNKWITGPFGNFVINPPKKACYFMVEVVTQSMGTSDPTGTQYKLGGVVVNYR